MSATAGATAATAGSSSSHAATTAAAISGATNIASVGGSMFSGHKNRKLAREQMRFNAEQAEKANQFNAQQAEIARKWQEDFYNKYESPQAQMRQKMEAGINPYSELGTPGSAPAAPSYSDAVIPSDSSFNTAMTANSAETEQLLGSLQQMSQVMQMAMSLKQQEAQIKQTEAETQSINQQTAIGFWQKDVMERELEEEDLLGFDHYGIGSTWYKKFVEHHGRRPNFADLHWSFVLQQTARDINRRNGLGSLDAQDPLMGWFRNWQSHNTAQDTPLAGQMFDGTRYGLKYGPNHSPEIRRFTEGSAYEDPQDEGSLPMMETLVNDLMSGHFDASNRFNRSAVESFMSTYKKGAAQNGLSLDPKSNLEAILRIMYSTNPDLYGQSISRVGEMLNTFLDGATSFMSNPFGAVFDRNTKDMHTLVDTLRAKKKKK